jgi:hypothetical protein
MISMYSVQMAVAGIVLTLATHAGAYWIGYTKGYDSRNKKAQIERAEITAQARANEDRLKVEGARLEAELSEAKTRIEVRYVDRVKTIYKTASVEKECLSSEVVSILNDEPTQSGTSEQAAAQWMAQAQAAHEQCKEQVISLIDWAHSVSQGGKGGN